MSLFRTKSIDALIAASEAPNQRLRRTLGPWSLTALGIGAVIGSGIFTLTGTAAAGKVIPIKSILEATVIDLVLHGSHAGSQLGRPGAGPAITLSFLLVAIACLFAGLCYAELASMIPIAGSAYTYSYAILGEIVACRTCFRIYSAFNYRRGGPFRRFPRPADRRAGSTFPRC